jgi:hypothetical protein
MADSNISRNKEVIIAIIGLLATIVTSLFSYLEGVSKGKDKGQQVHTVIPVNNVTQVNSFPANTSAANFRLLRDVSIYDLRAWIPVELKDKKKDRIQPCHYITTYI